jgi:hypothetical protein
MEWSQGLNPTLADTDGDGLKDGEEWYGTFGFYSDPRFPDTDGDYLSDFEEINIGTVIPGMTLNPLLADSDSDGVADYIVAAVLLIDTDGGGIPDRIERLYQLDPLVREDDFGDLDGDGTNNVVEYMEGKALNGDFLLSFDRDRDGMSDVWELSVGLNPNDRTDAAADPDGDWLSNLEEYRLNLDPWLSDGGIQNPTADGYTLDMLSEDWDGDGISNLDELLRNHSDPRDPSSTDGPGTINPCTCGPGGHASQIGCPLNGDGDDGDDDGDEDNPSCSL